MPFSFWFIPTIADFVLVVGPVPNFYFPTFRKYFLLATQYHVTEP